MSDEPQAGHCWHQPSLGFMRGDGAVQIVCCHCGERAFMVKRAEHITGHGPHHPNPVREWWEAPKTPCAPKP
jgi:hypothetical protein